MKRFENRKKIMIIGAGASGLTAGISAARCGAEVCILEHKDEAGKKLLLTGNGRCNYTNTAVKDRFTGNRSFADPYFGDRYFIDAVLRQFDYEDTLAFFKELGIYPKIKHYAYDNSGYVYPASMEAASVRAALLEELSRLSVQIWYETSVSSVTEERDGGYLLVTDKGSFHADAVIFAAGSNAYPKTGSDCSVYPLIKSLGHKFHTFLPALCSVKCGELCSGELRQLKGVRQEAKLRLCVFADNDMMMYEESGEVQFTESGLSGIPVMQLSRYVPYYLKRRQAVTTELDLLPEYSFEEVVSLVSSAMDRYAKTEEAQYAAQKDAAVRGGRAGAQTAKGKEAKENKEKKAFEDAVPMGKLLCGILPKKLSQAVMRRVFDEPARSSFARKYGTALAYGLKAEDYHTALCRDIASVIKAFAFEVKGTAGFDNAQCCSGGVDTLEVKESLESKLHSGIYFAGELLDVDGACGGFNLQWAWSSGYVAGKHAAEV